MEQGRYGLTPRIQRRSQSHGLTLQSYEVFLRFPNNSLIIFVLSFLRFAEEFHDVADGLSRVELGVAALVATLQGID